MSLPSVYQIRLDRVTPREKTTKLRGVVGPGFDPLRNGTIGRVPRTQLSTLLSATSLDLARSAEVVGYGIRVPNLPIALRIKVGFALERRNSGRRSTCNFISRMYDKGTGDVSRRRCQRWSRPVVAILRC